MRRCGKVEGGGVEGRRGGGVEGGGVEAQEAQGRSSAGSQEAQRGRRCRGAGGGAWQEAVRTVG